MEASEIMLHIARCECLTGGDASDFALWIERYAELLGCDARAGAVSVAIEALIESHVESEGYKRKYHAMIAKDRVSSR